MSPLRALAIATLGCSVLSACIVIPLYQEHPFDLDGDFAWLEIGETTREQVIFELGAPTRYRDSWLAYTDDRLRGAWFFGAGGTGDFGYIYQGYALLLQFDPRGRLLRRSIQAGSFFAGPHGPYGIVRAPSELDQRSKRFESRESSCSIYLYPLPPHSVAFQVDEQPLGPTTAAEFLHVFVPPGQHVIGPGQLRGGWDDQTLDLECDAAEILFVWWGNRGGATVPPAKGRLAVLERHLALDAVGGELR